MSYFTRTYEVWRSVQVQDPETGELVEVWDKFADVPGRAYPASVTDTIAAATPVGIITWTFACAPDAGVRIGDQIRFDDRVLAVKAVPVTSSGQRCECRCTEVQGISGRGGSSEVSGGNAFDAGPGLLSGGNAASIDGGSA